MGSSRTDEDPIVRFLRANGAERMPHANGRTLLDHLLGTRAILAGWSEPGWVRDAGALHSIYGTDVYQQRLVPFARRAEVRALAGERAERLAYLFAVVQRAPFFEMTGRLGPDYPDALRVPASAPEAGEIALTRPEISALQVLHAANELEQRAALVAERSRARFQRYVEAFPAAGAGALRTRYPDLTAQPWHDPARFSLVRALEAAYPAVRRELLAFDRAAFHAERERIQRRGAWDVLFLYQRGKKHADVCERCPVTTQIVEAHPTVRAPAGLIYVSRLAAGAHVAPHCGPTNVRLRCHLGLQVPAGDVALRVDGETRRWDEGRCLVFDDSFEHEAWNRTGADRLVLIVDLWHPDLSATEIALLEGLQRYALGYAHQYEGYWAANEGEPRSKPSTRR